MFFRASKLASCRACNSKRYLRLFFEDRKIISGSSFVYRRKISNTNRSSTVTYNVEIPDFSDTNLAYASKTNLQLLQAALVYNLCNSSFLVDNADRFLTLFRRIIGDTVIDKCLKATFFGQFCAGEDENKIKPTLLALKNHGVGGILDYAAEFDDSFQQNQSTTVDSVTSSQIKRTYDNESENICDKHAEIFQRCVRSVQETTSDGFAAVKITSLGNPKLLERMSDAIMEAKKLFKKFDKNGTGLITREEFEQSYRHFFLDGNEKVKDLIDSLDYNYTGYIDYITWSKLLSPSDIPRLVANCRENGPLAKAAPTVEELELIDTMFQRADDIAREAVRCKSRILIDAEQVRFQPAIDNLVLELQSKYNSVDKTEVPIIFNTYQCYRRGELDCIREDLERSERYNYHFGAKLVRGAYLESECLRARNMEYPSPIYDTIDETHQCYNDAVKYLLQQSVDTHKTLEIVCATHNQESIEKALEIMSIQRISKQSRIICFAQLLGMSDNLTFNLGRLGYRAYKYVPYGKVKEVMPYLLRRAKENSAVLKNSRRELNLLSKEIARRFRPTA